jgi:hypothetical protein
MASFLDRSPRQAADDAGEGTDDGTEHHAHLLGKEGTGDPGGKKKHHDNLIIIAVSIAGLILTYLIYRSRSSTAAATTATTGTTSTGTVAGSSGSSTNAVDPTAEAGVTSLQTALQQEAAQEQSDTQTNASAISGLQTMINNLGAELTTLEAIPPPTVGEGGGGTTTVNPGGTEQSAPPPTGLFGGTPIASIGNPGAYQGDASSYVAGFESIGGNPYTDYTLPSTNSEAQNAALLYGPGAGGLSTFEQYDPTGASTVAIPVYAGEPVVNTAPVQSTANVKAA